MAERLVYREREGKSLNNIHATTVIFALHFYLMMFGRKQISLDHSKDEGV